MIYLFYLLEFFNECYDDTDDPRSNYIFGGNGWPDLKVKTNDDINTKKIS